VITRRRFLAGTAAVAGPALLGLTGCTATDREQTAQLLRSGLPLPERFALPFRVPPTKVGRRTARGTAYEIVQRRADVEILPGVRTEIWGYDGLFPGPTIRGRRGETVMVRHRNRLPVPTVVHLHGGHTPADSDGYAVDYVLPESDTDHEAHDHEHERGDVRHGFRDYGYPQDQRAATLWYHDHRMDFTGPQVWRGLAGLHLIGDDEEDRLSLPAGDRDLPVMITDRSFTAEGALAYPSLDPGLQHPHGVTSDFHAGVLGDVVLVNGVPWPELEVVAARYRLRLVNASNARRYALALDPPPPGGGGFVQVGSDGGLLEQPVPHDVIPIAPAERFDVVVDFGRYPVGTVVTLRNPLGAGHADAVMRFRVVRAAREEFRVPARLAEIEPLRPPPGATVREWHFGRGRGNSPHWVINDLPFDPDRMDASVPLGQVEIWRFRSDVHHPVHVHLDPFQVLTRSGGAPAPTDLGWKDTVDLRAWETVEVAVRFTDHAGAYLLHCHNLEHEDMMMMAAFATVAT
jgi:FtsP/CotA-like multicopper oxidase with cupredoxin domain